MTKTMSKVKKKKPSIRGTKTEQNLVNAFIAESQAYARYTYYAGQAEKEEYYPIQKAFEETAANELRHGKVYMKLLEGGTLPCNINVDSVPIQDTVANLEIAIREESEEGIKIYLENAKVADEEGFPEIAEHFRAIAEIEELHMKRFQTYLDQVKNDTVWKREKPIEWQCLVCGYVYKGTEPPKICPACDHPDKHYKALDIQ